MESGSKRKVEKLQRELVRAVDGKDAKLFHEAVAKLWDFLHGIETCSAGLKLKWPAGSGLERSRNVIVDALEAFWGKSDLEFVRDLERSVRMFPDELSHECSARGRTPLEFLLTEPERPAGPVLDKLLELHDELGIPPDRRGGPLLRFLSHRMVAHPELFSENIEKLLAIGLHPGTRGAGGMTNVMFAAEYADAATLLAVADRDVNYLFVRDALRQTAFHRAASSERSPENLVILLECAREKHCIDGEHSGLFRADKKGRTPLDLLIGRAFEVDPYGYEYKFSRPHFDVACKLLRDYGAPPNGVCFEFWGPEGERRRSTSKSPFMKFLERAAHFKELPETRDMLDIFLDAGADRSLCTPEGKMPFELLLDEDGEPIEGLESFVDVLYIPEERSPMALNETADIEGDRSL